MGQIKAMAVRIADWLWEHEATGPAGHIEGTCGRNAPDKDEKDRGPNPKVSGPSRAKRLVASTCEAVRQLPATADQTWIKHCIAWQ